MAAVAQTAAAVAQQVGRAAEVTEAAAREAVVEGVAVVRAKALAGEAEH